MKEDRSNIPSCFGDIKTVFPKGVDGLRHSPEICLQCVLKTDCLRTAMKKPDGLRVEQEMIDRANDSRMVSFIERWSRKKTIKQKLKKSNKE